VKKALTEKLPQEYAVFPNSLVRKDVLDKIDKKIGEQMGNAGRLSLSKAARIIETEGVQDATSALESLGYKVVWHGINVEKAEVTKP
jgi:hypothetical protein